MKRISFLLLFSLFFSPFANAKEIFTKGGIYFSVETPDGFELRTLPREDLAYLAIAVDRPYTAFVTIQRTVNPRLGALFKNPDMKGAYLVDAKNETRIEEGSLTIEGFKAFYYVASSKEFMAREQKDLFQIQKKVELAREDEIFTLSFAATGWTIEEAEQHFESLRPVYEAMLSSFHFESAPA